MPTRRKGRGQDSSHGWLDYWVQKEENWVYLIEIKHAWQFLNGEFRKDSMEKLKNSINQLKNIRKNEIHNLSDVKTTYKISLIILPVWRNIPKGNNIKIEDKYPTDIKDLEKTAAKIIIEVKDKISWLGLWSTHSRMQEVFSVAHSKSLQTFAGVFLIATLVK